jgi:hypothetical protein
LEAERGTNPARNHLRLADFYTKFDVSKGMSQMRGIRPFRSSSLEVGKLPRVAAAPCRRERPLRHRDCQKAASPLSASGFQSSSATRLVLILAEQFMPMIHLVFSNLKTWLNGIHHDVSAKRLQAHLNEFTFRFNRRFYPFNAFRSLLGIAGGVEAPTYADLYSGAWTHPTCSGCLY